MFCGPKGLNLEQVKAWLSQYNSKMELRNMSKYKYSTVQNNTLKTEFRNSPGDNMFKDETLYYGPTNLYAARL
jgi:hypothetical protein